MIITRDGEEITAIYRQDGSEIEEVKDATGRLIYSASREITGTLPLYYSSRGKPLTDYLISGNAFQDGTPSSVAPVDATGSGVRTGNLWDNRGFSATGINLNHTHNISNDYGTTLSTTEGNEVTITQSAYPTGNVGYQNGFFTIDVDFSKYAVGDVITISFDYIVNEIHALSTQAATTVYAGKNTNIVPNTLSSGDWKISGRLTATITIIADMRPYVEVRLCGNSITVKNIMLNTGSTALPYEPYGYKLDISSGGENLFDATTLENGIYLAASGNKYGGVTNGVRSGTKIKVSPNTTYTLSAQSSENVSLRIFEWSNGAFTKQTPKYKISGLVSLTVTTTAETTEIAFNIEGENGQYATNIMLNLGSTAKPYSPYNRTATPIFLWQVETTRRIKKLVLTGEETIPNNDGASYNSETSTDRFVRDIQLSVGDNGTSKIILCTHLGFQAQSWVARTKTGCCIYCSGNTMQLHLRFDNTTLGITQSDTNEQRTEKLKAYLAAQYAAGTPVTVWYVLANPETGIVNEPLMKIGGYADTISFAQAEVVIPTVNGANVLDMTATVKPSEVYINGKGIKPTGYGQLVDNNSVRILDKNNVRILVHGQ